MFKHPRLETKRQHFWAYIMKRFPRLYRWCDDHLTIDTLPF